MAEKKQESTRRSIIAAGYGNALEWYDFGIYGFFVVIIGHKFFPSTDDFASLLSAFGAFAVGYLARPVGAIFLGHLGDHFGRKPVLLFSMVLMGVATSAIGLLPTFEQVGDLAPLLLVLLRLLQGFAVSGEYASSTVYLIERAPADRRGWFSSWSLFGQFVGLIVGSGLAALMSSVLSDAQLHDWGWRVPFLMGMVFGAIGFILRWQVPESPAMTAEESSKVINPFRVFRTEWRSICTYTALIAMGGVGFYLAYVYAVSDLTRHMKISSAQALDINTLALCVALVLTPLAGALSDKVGRRILAIIASLGTVVLAWPLWWLMHQPEFVLILSGQIGFAALFSLGWAAYAVLVSENLTLRTRCSVIAISNGIAYGIFGGLTPLIATYLVGRTADDFAPVYMIIVLAMLSFFAALRLRDRTGKPLL